MLSKKFTNRLILTSIILLVIFFPTINTFKSSASVSFQSDVDSMISPQLTSCGATPSFAGVQNLATANETNDIASGDFNGDGLADLVTVNLAANSYSVLINNGNGSFYQAVTTSLATNSNPTSVAVADFNLDGKLDLVITRGGLNSAQIFNGDGGGKFTAGNVISVGSGVQQVAIGDFNNDSRPDFATINTQSFTVALNSATNPGTFTASNVSTGGNSLYLLTGDFNSDGKTDVLVSRSNIGYVRLYPGNGNGTFGSPISIAVGMNPWGSTAGDFNKDGKLDVAVVNNASDTVSILLGTGSGLSTTPITINTINDPISIQMGDFNNDSKVDLAIVGFDSSTLQVLMGDGAGNFGSATTYSIGTNPFSVITGKFNADSSIDIATANYGSDNVSFLANNCCGTLVLIPSALQNTIAGAFYNQPISIEGGGKYSYVVTAGTLPPGLQISTDYASGLISGVINQPGTYNFTITASTSACSSTTSRNYTIVVGNPQPYTSYTTNTIAAGSSPFTVITADLYGDGKTGLVVTNNASNTVSTFVGDGVGNFTADETLATDAGPVGVAVGDFNEDGQGDIVTANAAGRSISVILSKPSVVVGNGPVPSSFADAANYGFSNSVNAVAVGDFNQDGHQDIAIAVDGQTIVGINLNAYVIIFTGNGDGTFTVGGRIEITLAVTKIKSLAVADFNKDGKQDIVIANYNNKNLTVCLATGANSFSKTLVDVAAGPISVKIGDFNKDGNLDVVSSNFGANTVSVSLGNGNGGFSASTAYQSGGTNPSSVEVADINGDGNSDLVVTHSTDGTVYLLTGKGDGTFNTPALLTTLSNTRSTAIGDFNGDHKLDMAITSTSTSGVSILIGR